MTTALAPCAHFWEIGPANGRTSKGVCRSCGETKDFANSLPEEEEEPGERHQLQLGRIPETRAEGKARRAEAIEQIRIRKEATNMAQKQSTGAIRIRQLAETKRRFFRMVAEDRSVEDIEAMLNEAPGGPPSGTSLRYWWMKAKKRAKDGSADAEGATKASANMPGNMPGQAKEEEVTIPIDLEALRRELQKSRGERLWELAMSTRPDFSDKPRLGRWMDMVDAVYAFLVECGE